MTSNDSAADDAGYSTPVLWPTATGEVAPESPDPGTPLYDELAATHLTTSPAEPVSQNTTPVPGQRADTTTPTTAATDLAQPSAVLDLFTRMKDLEDYDGTWNGGDAVEALCDWFTEFGIDVTTDEVAAAQTLGVPAWLASILTAPTLDDSSLVIHLRTEHPSALGSVCSSLSWLLQGLDVGTSAAVFDVAGDQIAHIVHLADSAAR